MSVTGPALDRLLVRSDDALHLVMERLQETGRGILLHVDDHGRLLQTLTDGDIRRLLLAGHALASRIGRGDLRPPRTLPAGSDNAAVLGFMDQHLIDHLPLVDGTGRPVELLLRRDLGERIWLSTPHMGDEEMRFVHQAFETNWIAPLGPNVDAFEREVASAVDVPHAAALSSGTAAIHLALILLGVKAGDRVLCSSLTFAASSNPILYLGAEPVFVDAEARSWNICPAALERALQAGKREGKLPKAVIVVDLYGQAADYDAITPICERYGVPIVEDAAEALGASYHGRPCGGFGRIGIFSFNGNKIITTSGGGMLVAEDEDLVRHARKLATQAREDAPWYEHTEIGYNFSTFNIRKSDTITACRTCWPASGAASWPGWKNGWQRAARCSTGTWRRWPGSTPSNGCRKSPAAFPIAG